MEAVLRRAAATALVVFDVDGVLTDGRLYLSDDGVETKAFHARDGQGLRMLAAAGVRVAVITGRRSRVVERRMAELGIEDLLQGRVDKGAALGELCAKLGVAPGAAAFVGDDLVDLPAMTRAGFAVAVADAHPLVREHAHWCTRLGGGQGAAREVCELVLEARGQLDACYRRWLGGAGGG